MHAKGVDQTMIDIAVATGMPVKLGAKYSAEHQSLGYQQADIRALEIPQPGHAAAGPFSLSSGARRSRAMDMRIFLRRGAATSCCFVCGRERSGICSPPTRRWRRRTGEPRIFAARPAWISWSR